MAFSQSAILDVDLQPDGTDLLISWTSSASVGTSYQVYVDHRLTWSGRAKRCQVPMPSSSSHRNIWVDVGTVAPGESTLDFSSQLSSLQLGVGKATLSWNGGTYLDSSGADQVQGFRIYQSPSAGLAVDFNFPVADLPAYPGGWVSDGFGLSGFGSGGFGRAGSSYQWTAMGLSTGLWQFCVIPYDPVGNNRGPGQSSSITIQTAPLPPAPDATGRRLTYSYDGPSTRLLTLNWLPSPSA